MPAKTKPKAAPTSRQLLSRQLRAAIADSGLTAYSLGRMAEVDAGVIQRFLNEERDIRMETADKLADVLGLRLVATARGRGRPAKAPRAARPDPAPIGQLAEEPEGLDGPGFVTAIGPDQVEPPGMPPVPPAPPACQDVAPAVAATPPDPAGPPDVEGIPPARSTLVPEAPAGPPPPAPSPVWPTIASFAPRPEGPAGEPQASPASNWLALLRMRARGTGADLSTEINDTTSDD